jgi:hypothetical protein
MTLLVEDQLGEEDERVARRREVLAKLRAANPFKDIDDPVKWQHEMRQDRAMPARSRAVMRGECDKQTAYGRRSDFGGAARSELSELACPAEWFGVSSNI